MVVRRSFAVGEQSQGVNARLQLFAQLVGNSGNRSNRWVQLNQTVQLKRQRYSRERKQSSRLTMNERNPEEYGGNLF